MRIVLLDVTKYEDVDSVRAKFPELILENRPCDAEIMSIVWSKIDPRKYPSLKYIINRSMGDDHINYDLMRSCGVRVLHIPDYCINAVADYVIRIIDKHWVSDPVVSVLGLGRIGKQVSNFLQSKGCKVFEIHHDSIELEIIQRLSESNFVTIHFPLTKESKHWLNINRVRNLNNAVLINTARGVIIDNEALLKGFEKGYIKCAYLDVAVGTAIRKHPNVVWTGHTAYHSEESRELRAHGTIEKILEAINGLCLGPN